jgi:uncharacterized lipoprotein YddW (UPF0748 family)
VQLPAEWAHPEVEYRGVWFSNRDMLKPKAEIVAKLDQLQRAGFNVLLLDSWFRGFAAFDGSEVAPQYPEFKGEDVFGWITREARARGMKVYSWPEYGFYAYYTKDAKADPSKGPILDAHPELQCLAVDGSGFIHNKDLGDFYGYCPSNPKSHELLATVIVESVVKYSLDGVNLDRIRYPAAEFCHCSYCKEHFKQDTGIDLAAFAPGTPEARKFLEWRREQTAKAVAHIRQRLHAARPGLPITAYVVGPFEMDSKAQGWDLWAKRGLVDQVAVSMYGADITKAADRALELLGGDRSKLICAINAELKPDVFLGNVDVARRYTQQGQFTWFAGAVDDADAKALGEGPYAKPAKLPAK